MPRCRDLRTFVGIANSLPRRLQGPLYPLDQQAGR